MPSAGLGTGTKPPPLRPARRRQAFVGGPAVVAGLPPLVAGAASFVSSGPAGIVVSAADATGGTPSYTYQWQRSTDGGSYSNLSNGSGVSGATTRGLTDGSAAAGHTYGYQLAYADSSGSPQTATSGTVTAALYAGGALAAGSAIIRSGQRRRGR